MLSDDAGRADSGLRLAVTGDPGYSSKALCYSTAAI
jgi:hypothetical protein